MDIFVPTETGHWVNEKFARMAEVINDYEPTIELAWIPPERRGLFTDKPFAIVHRPEGLKPYVIFSMDESELDHPERVLARIFNGDRKNQDPLNRLEAEERGRKLMELRAEMEKAEERQDFIKTVVGSRKHSFRHNGRIIPT